MKRGQVRKEKTSKVCFVTWRYKSCILDEATNTGISCWLELNLCNCILNFLRSLELLGALVHFRLNGAKFKRSVSKFSFQNTALSKPVSRALNRSHSQLVCEIHYHVFQKRVKHTSMWESMMKTFKHNKSIHSKYNYNTTKYVGLNEDHIYVKLYSRVVSVGMNLSG